MSHAASPSRIAMTSVIAKHEFGRLARSSATWVVAALFVGIAAWLFLSQLERWLASQTQIALQDHAPGLAGFLSSSYLGPLCVVLTVLAPLYAMRTFSDEFRDATWALWQSSPVPTSAVVLGKLLGTLAALSIPIGVATGMILSMRLWTPLDVGVLASSIIGLLLVTMASAAAGLYCSSLVKQPMLAAVMAIALLGVLWLLGSASSLSPSLAMVAQVSPGSHLAGFLQGFPSTANLAYFVLFTALFVILTAIRLDALRHVGN